MALFFCSRLITVAIALSLFQNSSAVDIIGSSQSISDGTSLASKEGVFEFGFFSRGNSKNRYVGIWYKNISVQTVIWVANRCNPINGSSGFLTVKPDGNLVLFSQKKSVVWSTNSSKQAKKPIAQLLNTGNLVLREEEDTNSENYLWQSFDYPTDTILPGMKFGWDLRKGLNKRITAWKNWDDPCSGDLSCGFGAEDDIYAEPYIWKGNATFYRSGPWNGIGYGDSRELQPNQLFDSHFVYNGNEWYYMYNLKNNSVISVLVLNQTNSAIQRLTWKEEDHSWQSYYTAPRDDCDNYGHCGAYGNCMVVETVGICQCLKGFQPKSSQQWDVRDWYEGCVP